MTTPKKKPQLKLNNEFLKAAVKIVDDKATLERAQRELELRQQRAEAARVKRAEREDIALEKEQKKIYTEQFKPVLEGLASLRSKGGGKLFTFDVDANTTEYNSNRYRDVPVMRISLGSTYKNASVLIKLVNNDEATHTIHNSLNAYTTTGVAGVLKEVARLAMEWEPEAVGAYVKREERKAKAVAKTPAPKR